jgi:hypothetical protein
VSACAKCGHDPDAEIAGWWEFVVEREVKSLNRSVSNRGGKGPAYWAAHRRYRDELAAWCTWFLVAARNHGIPKATTKRRLTLTRVYGKGQRDDARENLAGGCKVAVDAMVRQGLLVDDRPSCAEIHYAQERGPVVGIRVLLEELA